MLTILLLCGLGVKLLLVTNAAGGEACLTVNVMDGWVLARSAFNHTVNYRAVMVFGRPELVADADKERVLRVFTEHWFPGRWDRLRPVNRKELGATVVLSMPLDLASAKIRDGGAGSMVTSVASMFATVRINHVAMFVTGRASFF